MRYAISLDVSLPRDELVTLVDDPMTRRDWHEDLVAVEPVEGEPGLEGSSVRLVYERGGRRTEVVETVVASYLPLGMTTMTCANGSCAESRHLFEALDADTTRWTQHVTYAFTGPGMSTLGALMPGTLARRTRTQMQALKDYAEGAARASLVTV